MGNVAAWASQKLSRGSGNAIHGAVMTKIDPGIFTRLLPQYRLVAVSGTNGKTTTNHLITAALRAHSSDPAEVATNGDGANLRPGIASALAKNPRASIAVLEVDEQVLPDVISIGHPELVVMLNLSPDQLDRHHNIAPVGKAWHRALEALSDNQVTVVANVNEPLIVWVAKAAKNQIWVDTGLGIKQDLSLCPNCDAVLSYSEDDWHCPGCGLKRPTPHLALGADGQVRDRTGKELSLDLSLPGRFNAANGTMALAAVAHLGVPADQALKAMRAVSTPAGRFSTVTFSNDRQQKFSARLVLAKNPAGWAESLQLLTSDTVVLGLDSAIADGTDVSWIWDVDFDSLRGKKIFVLGRRRLDLALRLTYAGLEHRVIETIYDMLDDPEVRDHQVDVLAAYTTFAELYKAGQATETAEVKNA